MYLTYYVHLVGIKSSDWLQKCAEWKTSKFYRGLAWWWVWYNNCNVWGFILYLWFHAS